MSTESDPLVPLCDIWAFMDHQRIGVGHVADMKDRASQYSIVEGYISLSKVPDVIGDAALAEQFTSHLTLGMCRAD